MVAFWRVGTRGFGSIAVVAVVAAAAVAPIVVSVVAALAVMIVAIVSSSVVRVMTAALILRLTVIPCAVCICDANSVKDTCPSRIKTCLFVVLGGHDNLIFADLH